MANAKGFAMAAAVRVREDYEAEQIRVLAKRSKNAAQTRRLLALAAIYDGGSRTEAARRSHKIRRLNFIATLFAWHSFALHPKTPSPPQRSRTPALARPRQQPARSQAVGSSPILAAA